jgi:hypothetical protein
MKDPNWTYPKGWRINPLTPNSHEYFDKPGYAGDYVIDLSAEAEGWDAYWWEGDGDTGQAVVPYDVIPEEDVEGARKWALIVWRMR